MGFFSYTPDEKLKPYIDGIHRAIASGGKPEQVFSYLKTKNPALESQLRKEYVMTGGFKQSKLKTTIGNFIGGAEGLGSGIIQTASNAVSLLPGVNTKPVVDNAIKDMEGQMNNWFGDQAAQSYNTGNTIGKFVGTTAATLPVGGLVGAGVKAAGMRFIPAFLNAPKITNLVSGGAALLGKSLAETTTFKQGMTGEAPDASDLTFGTLIDAALTLPFWAKGIWKGVKSSGGGSQFMKNVAESSGFSPKQVEIMTRPENKQAIDEMLSIAEGSSKNPELSNVWQTVGKDTFKKFQNFVSDKSLIGKQIGDVYKNSNTFIETSRTKQVLNDVLDEFNVGITQPKSQTLFGTELGKPKLDFANSRISNPADQELISFLHDKVSSLSDGVASFQGWLTKGQLENFVHGKLMNEAMGVTEIGEVPFIKTIKALNGALTEANPGLKELNSQYAKMTDAFSFLNKKLGPDGAKSGAFVKSIMSETVDQRAKDYLKMIYSKSAADILTQVEIANLASEVTKNSGGSLLGEVPILKAILPEKATGAVLKQAGLPDTKQGIIALLMNNAQKNALATTGKKLSNENLIRVAKAALQNLFKTGALSGQL